MKFLVLSNNKFLAGSIKKYLKSVHGIDEVLSIQVTDLHYKR